MRVQLKIEKSKIYRNLDIRDEREQEVIRGRFGLDHGGDERTKREIAKEPGISRSYVSRLNHFKEKTIRRVSGDKFKPTRCTS